MITSPMKAAFSLVFLALVLRAPAAAPVLPEEVGLLPGQKVPVEVAETERNPFGKRIIQAAEPTAKDPGGEETKIRDIIEKLPLQGVTKSGGRIKVLLGSLSLEEGKILPELFASQTEKLRVLHIDDKKIEMGFVEKDGSAEARKMVLFLDFAPTVRYKIGPGSAGGQPRDGGAGLGGVIKKNAPATTKE